jgi:hypothetical protein
MVNPAGVGIKARQRCCDAAVSAGTATHSTVAVLLLAGCGVEELADARRYSLNLGSMLSFGVRLDLWETCWRPMRAGRDRAL